MFETFAEEGSLPVLTAFPGGVAFPSSVCSRCPTRVPALSLHSQIPPAQFLGQMGSLPFHEPLRVVSGLLSPALSCVHVALNLGLLTQI